MIEHSSLKIKKHDIHFVDVIAIYMYIYIYISSCRLFHERGLPYVSILPDMSCI